MMNDTTYRPEARQNSAYCHGEVLSRIDRFSLGPNEEGSKRGVMVLKGAGILARGTESCT